MSTSHGTTARVIDAGSRYHLLRALGEGSYGAVYRARLEGTAQELAIKALTRAKPEALARFKREFRALCEVSHPNLVGLRELFEHEGQWFIAMDLVEGTDLLTWVRPSANDGAFDEARLRKAFADVAQGLSALHAHGLLHRDLKPSNARVTPEGKAMLLDFGLVTVLDQGRQSTQRQCLGTLGYMAPEQVSGEKLSAAADLYSLGASLYEALTGRLPHVADNALALMLRKMNEQPVPPQRLFSGVPGDLDSLCTSLLETNPRLRPSVETVLRTLLGESCALEASHPNSAPADPVLFEGREEDLSRLAQALARTHEGELSLMFVEGESGIGKSALVAEFVRKQLEAHPETWVLTGRCYEHERVPYKAFDAGMDALAKYLDRLAPELCRAVLPRRAGLLVELFPVLGAVRALAESRTFGAPVEPAARRLEAFDVLASLLGKLAESRPLIVLIDDLQWADEESLRLLRHLVHGRSASILLVATLRPGRELSAPIHKLVEELRKLPETEWLLLFGLSAGAVESLASKVLSGASLAVIDQISQESQGHPMLVSELCNYAATAPGAVRRLTLEAALEARVTALTSNAQGLLAAFALCGRPHPEAFFKQLELAASFEDTVKELFAARLARRGVGHTLAIAHDRVRGAVLSQLEVERRRALHLRLARALERTRLGEPSELAEHWELGGERQRAGSYYLEAAKLAMSSLACSSAAEHYARALALLGDGLGNERAALFTEYGRALAGAGKSVEAAAAFTEAAACVEGAERIRLRVLAAQHQIQGARFEEGIGNARAVLRDLGVPLPDRGVAALARIAWERGWVALRGTKVKLRTDIAAIDRLRLDAMRDLSFPVFWADFLPGAALSAMHFRRAFESGEIGHTAFALAQEAALRAALDDKTAVASLLALARPLVEQSQLPAVQAFVQFGEGVTAFISGEMELALTKLASSEAILMTSCPEEAWLLTNVRMMIGMTLSRRGEYLRFASSFRRWLAEAEARQDAFASNALFGLGLGHISFLMEDRPGEALERIERTMQPWGLRRAGFAETGELFCCAHALLYQGGADAHRWLSERRAAHEGSLLMRQGVTHLVKLFARANGALAACVGASGARRAELLGTARLAARSLPNRSLGSVFRPLTIAQIEALSGNTELALASARVAGAAAEASGERTYGLGAEYLQGVLEGGDGGRARCEAVLAFFREGGWKDPWRAATMHAPAARELEGGTAPSAKTSPLFLGRYRLIDPLPPPDHDALVDALEPRSGRTITLQLLGRTDPARLAQLKEEVRVLGGVHHEHLAHSEELYEHDGRLIVVLERVPNVCFLDFVRPAAQLDVERLRSALAQVLAGLAALHGVGAVHGELRASLVRVSDAGRVLILGRGSLGTRAGDREEPEDLDYLAPEQIEGAGPSAAADVYALGTCLYQALTGQLPFEQLTAQKVRKAKRCGRPVPPWALRATVPSDLEELCLAMLEREPGLRPSVSEAQAGLNGPSSRAEAARQARRAKALAALTSSQVVPAGQRAFIGRTAELGILEAELARAVRGEAAVLVVQGEGGIGKTTLVNEALDRFSERVPDGWVLRSRCYANEQLRFQAFDGAVDELARRLNTLGAAQLKALLPARAALLAQLFPALESVAAIRGASKRGCPAEPSARRVAAIEAFVELLVRLSRSYSLALIMDDLQWADGESFALLSALLAKCAATRLVLVAMLRPGEARDEGVRDALAELLARPAVCRVHLAELSDADARALARRLLGTTCREVELALAVRESAGHPLFLRELAQARVRGGSGAHLDLEHALLQRVAELSAEARHLLELLALLSRPCPVHVLERAAGLRQEFDEALRALLRAGLAQRRGPLGLTCFHDRLREVVAGHIAPPRVPPLLGTLAEALVAEPEADPAELARLWDGAAEAQRACAAYGLAGERALEALSFATAERLFARAIELATSLAEAPLAHLLTQRAHAFVALGQSARGAALFEQAAQHASGADVVRLKVWAAQHQIQSAQFEDGIRNARAVLEELEVPLPEGTAGALARIGWDRTCVTLRGTKVKLRTDIDAWDRLRLDAMRGLGFPVFWADFLPGCALTIMHLRKALAVGDPGHAAHALAQEASLRATLNDRAEVTSLLAVAVELAEQSQLPAVVAFVQFAEGIVAMMRADPGLALRKCTAAEELLISSCPEEAWLLTNVRMTISILLYRDGDFAPFSSSVRRWFAEAETRQDAFASNALVGLGLGHVAFLMDDRPEEALEVFDRTMRPWRSRPAGFAQAGELFAKSNILLYRGGTEGHAWFSAQREAHDRSLLLRRGVTYSSKLFSRANAALSAAISSATGRAERLAEARALTRSMAGISHGVLLKALTSAQLDALCGNSEGALQAARRALEAAEALGERTTGLSAEYLIGVLEGGAAGHARREGVLSFFRERGWKDPWRAATILIPAARELEGKAP